MNPRLVLGSPRELGTVALVAGLVGGYVGIMVTASSVLVAIGDNLSGHTQIALAAVSSVFVGIALYVAAVVMANAVDTVIAGRTPQIALLRLLGARATDLRRSVLAGTSRIGLVAAGAGTATGMLFAAAARQALIGLDQLPDAAYPWLSRTMAVESLSGIAAIALIAGVAGWSGSRSVLQVSPNQAITRASAESCTAPGRLRLLLTGALALPGGLLLARGMQLGERNPESGDRLLIAFAGAALIGAALLVGARFVVPALVSGCGRIIGNDPSSLIARRNSVRNPARTTRCTIGLVVGLTLVTTIASGLAALRTAVRSWSGLEPWQVKLAETVLDSTAAVLISVLVISSILAVIGFVSTMSLTVLQRRREIGLLRAMGFTATQIRSMITREAVALSATAILLGVLLGIGFGSAGAQALIGFRNDGFIWGLPWFGLLAIVGSGVVLVVLASWRPARRAVRVSPIEALRV